ncbi:MAG TPA: cytochrome c [Gemmatimonadaceae bacterium]|nr:cytochrome c [Gemmatimonadaceae bacterium]
MHQRRHGKPGVSGNDACRTGWTFLAAACILATPAATLEAQSPGPSAGRSTQQGVYTREQAIRGKDTFAGSCTGCHTPASHTGAVFTNGWVGKSVADLFRYVSDNMPKNDPGILTAREYADLAAYLLMLNRMPMGSAELPADPAVLEKIRIDTASANGRGQRP